MMSVSLILINYVMFVLDFELINSWVPIFEV